MTTHHPQHFCFAVPLYVHPSQPVKGSYLLQAQRERSCMDKGGHWWHPDAMIDWYCCQCGATSEGMPKDGTGNRRRIAVFIANLLEDIIQ